ncbi:uncharacterized protein [Haliotis cracherodii]|uniref:uncharacterized protein n=1 Tax=Haliotis cracherodii TaxID=6455 RepID=UPI0039E795AC
MATRWNLLSVLSLCVLFRSSYQLIDQVTIDMDCDPSISNRMNDCPNGYCCVRDEFLPSYVYCKKMGVLNMDCTMRVTESACPCVSGMYCRPNIESATFHSLYGKCQLNTTAHGSITG